MKEIDHDELMEAGNFAMMDFKLADLKANEVDPRGRLVLDILWSVNEFKIYKTERGISPFFSDEPEAARIQKLAYLDLGSGIAEFNHLIGLLLAPILPFTEWLRSSFKWVLGNVRTHDASDNQVPGGSQRNGHSLDEKYHYERELARCIAQALIGQTEQSRESLNALIARLAAHISNRGRVRHLLVNIFLVSVIILVGLSLISSGVKFYFDFNTQEIVLAFMMGSIGALFSTTVRLQSMTVDPEVTNYMHWVYAFQRVTIGALGALILFFGFKSGVLEGLLPGSEDLPLDYSNYWLAFVSVLAGFSERMVPNLLEVKSSSSEQSG